MQIHVVKSVLKANDALARENRKRLHSAGTLTINITSAPGSGKTTLLEKTIAALAPATVGIVVGDLQTTRDAQRLAEGSSWTTQINTEGGCHLSATQVSDALDQLADGPAATTAKLDYLFIENVGNMVCTAGFDLGEDIRVAMLSIPEGDDKVAKYPTLFQRANVIIVNKIELLDVLEFDMQRVRDDLTMLNSTAPLFELSAKTGQGLEQWTDYLTQARNAAAG